MPNNVIKGIADESDKSVDEVEKLWDKAKKEVKDQYDLDEEDGDKFYKLVTGVTKRMAGLNVEENTEILDNVKKLINEVSSNIDYSKYSDNQLFQQKFKAPISKRNMKTSATSHARNGIPKKKSNISKNKKNRTQGN